MRQRDLHKLASSPAVKKMANDIVCYIAFGLLSQGASAPRYAAQEATPVHSATAPASGSINTPLTYLASTTIFLQPRPQTPTPFEDTTATYVNDLPGVSLPPFDTSRGQLRKVRIDIQYHYDRDLLYTVCANPGQTTHRQIISQSEVALSIGPPEWTFGGISDQYTLDVFYTNLTKDFNCYHGDFFIDILNGTQNPASSTFYSERFVTTDPAWLQFFSDAPFDNIFLSTIGAVGGNVGFVADAYSPSFHIYIKVTYLY